MKNFKLLLVVSCWFTLFSVKAQEFSGYVSGMPSIFVLEPESEVWWQALLHNRLNFGKQIGSAFRIDAGLRNRLITGSEAMLNPKSIGHDPGWIDLSWNWKEGGYAVGNTTFDRLSLTFEKNKWKLQLGRQRINWGQTFVWNPNDIFNTYSFFDFDYPERPGCDAFRATFFHNATSSSELAASVNTNNKITAAFQHRWNWNNVDFQVIAGEQTESDIVVGGAVTGDIKGLNIRTEMAYFHPIKHLTDTSGIVSLSLGLDYVFSNALMLQAEVLYNNAGKSSTGNGLTALYAAPLSAKKLSICEWTLFSQVSYPLTPRLKGSLSDMYFVGIQSCYVGLSFEYSIVENLDFSLISQYFTSFGTSTIGKMHAFLGFARIKYSF